VDIAVVGVGLIGGSVALAARERLGASVATYDAADADGSLEDAVAGADVVVVATPPRVLADSVRAALAAAPGAVVTDTGSVKRGLPEDERFVGGHPLAGGTAPSADLFDGAPWFLTRRHPVVEDLVRGLGAEPHVVDAEAHDRWMALTSHLPHLIADALADLAADGQLPTGPSFASATRVAGQNPALWEDIYAANGDFIAEARAAFVRRLEARP
jgi:prephenate dehydrogenase